MYSLKVATEKYQNMINRMKESGKALLPIEQSIARCLYFTGWPELVENAEELYRAYPQSGFRPFKAAGYVHHDELQLVPDGFQLAERYGTAAVAIAHRRSQEIEHEISVTSSGLFCCSCMDFMYNVRPLDVQEGVSQQPCCHIYALALKVPSVLKIFLGKKISLLTE